MSCRATRDRLSAYLDGGLPAVETRSVADHLRACAACADRRHTLERALALLAEAPRLRSEESVAARVMQRLDVERRSAGLALVLRPVWAARPLMLPSLLPAAVVLLGVLAGALALSRDPRPSVALAGDGWGRRAPAWGTEGNPLVAAAGVSVPQVRSRIVGAAVPTQEGSLFLETVVSRDGRVAAVTLLNGDVRVAAPVVDALRRERFEPGRFRGRPVAVSLYRLISRMDVRAPRT
jgi:anti-sigma factor RsiW